MIQGDGDALMPVDLGHGGQDLLQYGQAFFNKRNKILIIITQ